RSVDGVGRAIRGEVVAAIDRVFVYLRDALGDLTGGEEFAAFETVGLTPFAFSLEEIPSIFGVGDFDAPRGSIAVEVVVEVARVCRHPGHQFPAVGLIDESGGV